MSVQRNAEIKSSYRFKVFILIVLMCSGVLLITGCSKPRPRSSRPYTTTSIDNLKSLKVDLSKKIAWQRKYDEQDRLSEVIDPSGRSTRFTYSEDANEKTTVTKTNDQGETVTLEFDERGLLGSMRDSHGDVNYLYDTYGRLIQVQRAGEPAIKYEYDVSGRIISQSVGNLYTLTRTFDFLGRLSSIKTPAGIINYEYHPGEDMVVRSLPNGIKTYYRRKGNGELKEITHGYFKDPNSNSYMPLAIYSYRYGPDGKIIAINEKTTQGSSEGRFDYDNMGRLIQATRAGGETYTYAYDSFSNRIQASTKGANKQSCTFDWAGRLVTLNGDSTRYDANSNLIETTRKKTKKTYRYHVDGRIARVRVGEDATAYYWYDGFGLLIKRSGTKGQTSYTPDPLSGIWKPLVIDEGGSKTLVLWDGNTPLAIVRNGNVEWLLHDHLGSVRMTVDADGKIQETYDYDPFGVPLKKKNVSSPVPGFAGLFWDETAGGYLTMARLYDPYLGAFLQPDPQKRLPTSDSNDLSLFAYCGGDPFNFVDLDGAEPRTIDEIVFDWNLEHITDTYEHAEFLKRRDFIVEGINEKYGYGYAQDKIRNREITEIVPANKYRDSNKAARLFGKVVLDLYGSFLRNNLLLMKQGRINLNMPVVPDYHNYSAQYLSAYNRMQKGVNRFNVFLDVLGYTKTYLDQVRLRARAFQAIDPPRYLHKQTASGWEGSGSYKTPYGLMTYEEHQKANVFNQNPITRIHEEEIKSPEFIYHKKIEIKVGGLSWWDKFLENVFPRETLYGPEYERVIRTSVSFSDDKKGVNTFIIENEPSSLPSISGGSKMIQNHGVPMDKMISTPEDFNIISPSPIGIAYVERNPVGGVALSGAGGLIEGIGVLKGVQVDENGNMILIGEDDKNIELPSLRLDDLVTIFRSVYINGEGPSVTIDPNPKNPHGRNMIIRHSAATDSTYVGWVLYQADRLMKGYGQGKDNITQKDIKSTVPGYNSVMDTVYFGGGDPFQRQKGGNWERFWIVPAEATRFQGDRQKLTLFDVPLKVNTQKMKWVGNELIDDHSGKSSPGAKAFSSWFTRNYEGISKEQFLKPPKETGITTTVPVFAELKRVALMTAIAERLRDQGVAMPFWMYDYEIRKIPFEQFTPALVVERQKTEGSTTRIARIFGGVSLSADDNVIRTYSRNSSGSSPEIRQNISLANQLEKKISNALSSVSAAPLAIKSLKEGNKTFKVASVPGANTLALGPCRLNEPDMVVPIPGNRSISLVRKCNSFFNPRWLWGKGWTLDLPRLQKVRVPNSRQSGKVSYLKAHVLLTPLNSIHAKFLKGLAVKNFSNPQSPSVDSNSPFRSLTHSKPRFLSGGSTLMLRLKDGREWYFAESGQLVAWKDGPQVTVYEREKGRIKRIVALYGNKLAGEIILEYNGKRLAKVTGKALTFPSSKPLTVTYNYDDKGRLLSASSDEGHVGYKYQRKKVSAITWQEKNKKSRPQIVRTFTYDDMGRLVSDKNGEKGFDYTIAAESNGMVASTTFTGGDSDSDSLNLKVYYDHQMRPLKAFTPYGVKMEWDYPSSGSVAIKLTDEDGQSLKVVDSPDGKSRTIERNGKLWYSAGYNQAGQLTRLSDASNTLLKQFWRPDGQLDQISIGSSTGSLKYNNQGLLTSILLHPSGAGKKLNEWRETRVDAYGRPVEVKDYRGLHIYINYDQTGALTSIGKKNPNGLYNGIDVSRNKNGLIDTINSSWGKVSYAFDKDKNLKNVLVRRNGQSSSVELSNGRVKEISNFDGGITSFSYQNDDSSTVMLYTVTCPDKLILKYIYDEKKRISSVNVGKKRQVILEYDQQGRVVSYAFVPVKR